MHVVIFREGACEGVEWTNEQLRTKYQMGVEAATITTEWMTHATTTGTVERCEFRDFKKEIPSSQFRRRPINIINTNNNGSTRICIRNVFLSLTSKFRCRSHTRRSSSTTLYCFPEKATTANFPRSSLPVTVIGWETVV